MSVGNKHKIKILIGFEINLYDRGPLMDNVDFM